MQRKATFHTVAEVLLTRPFAMPKTRLLMRLHALVPDPCRFHLRLFETLEEHRSKMSELIHAHCFHTQLFFFFARKAVMRRMRGKTRGVGSLSSRPLFRGFPLESLRSGGSVSLSRSQIKMVPTGMRSLVLLLPT